MKPYGNHVTVGECEVNISLPTAAYPFPELKLAYVNKVSPIRGKIIGYPIPPKKVKIYC